VVDLEEGLRGRVQALMPDLEIEQIEVNREGLINDVVIVNGQWVFRFAKTQRSAEILAQELKILDLVRPRVSLEVPTPVYRGADAIVYPHLEGEPLLRETLYDLEPSARARLSEQ
jgi:aminoglycoside 2''-phosphotransferase